MACFRRLIWALTRRKPMDVSESAPTDLNRCLNTLDLTAMGVGATLGLGLYVLSGEVAATKAGPGVVLSFMIAAVASTLSALCYAEFAAKVPKSGSAYAYSYITVGEFVAFVIGWNLTLEHVIGTATLARGYSGYLSSLFAATSTATTTTTASFNQSLSAAPFVSLNESSSTLLVAGGQHLMVPEALASFAPEFDWLAFLLTAIATGLLLLGVEVSSKFQITFATLNLAVVSFIFCCGLFKADLSNWHLSPEQVPAGAGSGGFLPFGWSGVIAGASTCFFAFVGFDGIAASAEEVKNPRKAIPNSILWTSAIIFVVYSGLATVQTLIWPYWDQKQPAPLPYIFNKLNMPLASYTILVGVLAGLSTSFVGGFLPLPRILYAMARDGVIYRVMSKVNKRFKVPIVATIVGGVLIACLASVLKVDALADMLSIGTLAAYSLVSLSVLLLRYEHQKPSEHLNPLPLTSQDVADVRSQRNQNLALVSNGASLELSSSNKLNQRTTSGPANGNTNNKSPQQQQQQSTTFNHQHQLTKAQLSTQDSNSSSSGSSDQSSSSELSITGSSSRAHPNRSLVAVFWDGSRGPNNTLRLPDEQTTAISRVIILLLILLTTTLDLSVVLNANTIHLLKWPVVSLCSVHLAAILILGLLLNRLPIAQSATNSFEVPLVPLLPLCSVTVNTYLMLNLSIYTWYRFGVWMIIGFVIYFTYGIFESTGYKDSRCD